MERLAGRTALVTGGSSGIGAATARTLAAAGTQVIVGFNRGQDRAETLVGELAGSGHSALGLRLEDTASIKRGAERIAATYGKLDILVNSAGFTKPVAHHDLDALDDDLFDAVLTANVRGVFATIRALSPLLKQSGRGVIVNVSSISAFTGSGSSIAYCASKAAVDTMTMSLARVLGPEIRVLSVSPAAVATGFVAGRDRPALEKGAQATPLKVVVEAEDVADAILACITHLRTATGTRIVIDGGRHL